MAYPALRDNSGVREESTASHLHLVTDEYMQERNRHATSELYSSGQSARRDDTNYLESIDLTSSSVSRFRIISSDEPSEKVVSLKQSKSIAHKGEAWVANVHAVTTAVEIIKNLKQLKGQDPEDRITYVNEISENILYCREKASSALLVDFFMALFDGLCMQDLWLKMTEPETDRIIELLEHLSEDKNLTNLKVQNAITEVERIGLPVMPYYLGASEIAQEDSDGSDIELDDIEEESHLSVT